jgi:uncharacterized Zn-binding protein involved in type VI secretion
MPAIHRNGDSRACGATTSVTGQDFVVVDGQLWAVEGDGDTHGAGALIASQDFFTIAGKLVILVGDSASPDSLCAIIGGAHCNPYASSGDSAISVG